MKLARINIGVWKLIRVLLAGVYYLLIDCCCEQWQQEQVPSWPEGETDCDMLLTLEDVNVGGCTYAAGEAVRVLGAAVEDGLLNVTIRVPTAGEGSGMWILQIGEEDDRFAVLATLMRVEVHQGEGADDCAGAVVTNDSYTIFVLGQPNEFLTVWVEAGFSGLVRGYRLFTHVSQEFAGPDCNGVDDVPNDITERTAPVGTDLGVDGTASMIGVEAE